jgi:hypothetical protein
MRPQMIEPAGLGVGTLSTAAFPRTLSGRPGKNLT